MTEELTALAAKLESMSHRHTRNDFTIGDHWNACDEAADMLRKAAQEIEALRHDLSRHIEIASETIGKSGKTCPRGKESQALAEAIALLEERSYCSLLWPSLEAESEDAKDARVFRAKLDAFLALFRTRDSQTVNELPASQDEHVQTERCGFDRNASITEDRYVCECGWRARV